MEENKVFSLPSEMSKYIIRSTQEEVEVVAFNQVENGARSNDDWVTYIDSQGKEHIKEHLNIQLDFKAKISDVWSKIMDFSSKNKYPTERNRRIYDVAKELFFRNNSIDDAVTIATQLVDKIGIELE